MIFQFLPKLLEFRVVITDTLSVLYLSKDLLLDISSTRTIPLLELIVNIKPHLTRRIKIHDAPSNWFINNINQSSTHNVVAA